MKLCFSEPGSDRIKKKDIRECHSLTCPLQKEKMESQSLDCHASCFFKPESTQIQKKKVICRICVCMCVRAWNTYMLKSHVHSVDKFCQFVQISERADCPCLETFLVTAGEGMLLHLVGRSQRCC